MKSKKIRAKDIDLIVYDFDGVMTDNRVLVAQDGTEFVFCNRADGFAVRLLRERGVKQLIMSTESNPVVKARSKKLKLSVMSNVKDKKSALKDFCKKNKYDLKKVVYVGNDLNDLEAMKIVGFPVAPRDAAQAIKKIALIVTKTKGGEGVIRELFSNILTFY